MGVKVIAEWSGSLDAGEEIHVNIRPIDLQEGDLIHIELFKTTPPAPTDVEIGITSEHSDYLGFHEELIFHRYIFESLHVGRIYGRIPYQNGHLGNIPMITTRNHQFYLKNNGSASTGSFSFKVWIERTRSPMPWF